MTLTDLIDNGFMGMLWDNQYYTSRRFKILINGSALKYCDCQVGNDVYFYDYDDDCIMILDDMDVTIDGDLQVFATDRK